MVLLSAFSAAVKSKGSDMLGPQWCWHEGRLSFHIWRHFSKIFLMQVPKEQRLKHACRTNPWKTSMDPLFGKWRNIAPKLNSDNYIGKLNLWMNMRLQWVCARCCWQRPAKNILQQKCSETFIFGVFVGMLECCIWGCGHQSVDMVFNVHFCMEGVGAPFRVVFCTTNANSVWCNHSNTQPSQVIAPFEISLVPNVGALHLTWTGAKQIGIDWNGIIFSSCLQPTCRSTWPLVSPVYLSCHCPNWGKNLWWKEPASQTMTRLCTQRNSQLKVDFLKWQHGGNITTTMQFP